MKLQTLIKSALYRAGYSIKRIRPAGRTRGQNGGAPPASGAEPGAIRGLLHAVDPYEGFDFAAYPFDPSGWGGGSAAFGELIETVRPKLVIEVGTWKGASALTMAEACVRHAPEAVIVCVDTWLGALEFWMDQRDATRFGALELRHGYPGVYYRFLANVCHAGHQGRIVPFPQTSATAALWFRCRGVKADLVYLDGSHEEEDVYGDLCDYWEVVRPGGVLFGDDYGWDGVRLAVDRFAGEMGSAVRFVADKWVLAKG